MGMGIIGTVAWGIDPTIVMGISVLIVCIYTFFGGMWSVTVTDAIQFFFMTSVLVAFLPPIWEMVGGFSACAYVKSLLLIKVFRQYEPEEGEI